MLKFNSVITRQCLDEPIKRRPKEGAPCCVCGLHDMVTEKHHVLTVDIIADMLNEGIRDITTPTVWLCPNCHKYVHLAIKAQRSLKALEKFSKAYAHAEKDFKVDWDKYHKIIELAQQCEELEFDQKWSLEDDIDDEDHEQEGDENE